MRPRLFQLLRAPWVPPIAAFLFVAAVIGCGGAGGGASASGDSGTGSGGSNSGTNTGGSNTGGSNTGGTNTGGVSGGTSSGGTSGGTTGGTTGGALQIVPSSVGGQFELQILTGVGRAIDNYDIEVTGMELRGGAGSLLSGFSPRWVSLDLYGATTFGMTAATSPASRSFTQFLATFSRLQEPGGAIFTGPIVKSVLCDIRLNKGRTTAVQMLLDPTMFLPEDAVLTFNDAAFDALNTSPYGGTLPAFFTDLVRFDVSGLVSRPTLEAGGLATQVFLSGDLVGLAGSGNSGFETIFNLDRSIETQPIRRGIASSASPGGTYTVQQSDPLGGATAIPRISGAWQDAGQVVLNMGSFVALAFPSADPGAPDHFGMFARNEAGAITELWVGLLDAQAGFFTVFPIAELKLFRSTVLAGTITDNGTGGTYAIASGPRPASFPASGTYLRYLR